MAGNEGEGNKDVFFYCDIEERHPKYTKIEQVL